MKTSREQLVEQTRDGYDRMAKDWAGTRMNFWSELTQMVTARLSPGMKILDLGCGNARFYREISELTLIYQGADISEGLIEQAHKYHPELELVVCDARHTPYQDNSFDIVVSFAVAHHFPGRKAQEDFFKEIYRVLAPGGTAVVTTWNIWKTRKRKILKDYLKHKLGNIDWKLGDTMMDFTHHKETRFVHAFTQREFRARAEAAGLTILEEKIVERASKKVPKKTLYLS
jgi:ubiquinone/menaquinone biosynthesis C-methylase UbiE